MELPTYTSIWRIEKRLYKLYDFRLPMPLPVGQIAVFTAFTVPYVVLLTLFGLPFNHTLFWLYVLPPGVLTWLATRPVLESKRLPELLGSQLRYLGEPSAWCRLAPLAEKDDVLVVGRVWRRGRAVDAQAAEGAGAQAAEGMGARAAEGAGAWAAERAGTRAGRRAPLPQPAPAARQSPWRLGARPERQGTPRPPLVTRAEAVPEPPARARARHAVPAEHPWPPVPARGTPPPVLAGGAAEARAQPPSRATGASPTPPGPWAADPVKPPGASWAAGPVPRPPLAADPALLPPPLRAAGVTGRQVPEWPARGSAELARDSAEPAGDTPGSSKGDTPGPVPPEPAATGSRDGERAGEDDERATELAHEAPPASAAGEADQAPGTQQPPARPPHVVVVPAQRSVAGRPQAAGPRSAPAVERALGGPAGRRTPGWRGHVTVVPGGHGPGRPDHDKQARARAVLPLAGPRLVMVLGCTVGAGQTVTTLMLAELLASLRGEPVAALDMNPGPASLTELARVPATTASALLAVRASAGHPAHAAPSARKTARGPRTAAGGPDVICDDLATAGAGPGGPAAGGSDPSRAAAGHPARSRWAVGRAPGAAVRSGRLFDVLASRYALTLADPGAAAVARVLPAADGLVLVAPASPDAARAVGMTLEWLGAHGYEGLCAQSVAVLNGVSQRSVQHAKQAELVLRGRCRAIVRVPWDDHLAEPQHERGIRESLAAPVPSSRMEQLRPAVFQAYTALAGVLVASLAAPPTRGRAAR